MQKLQTCPYIYLLPGKKGSYGIALRREKAPGGIGGNGLVPEGEKAGTAIRIPEVRMGIVDAGIDDRDESAFSGQGRNCIFLQRGDAGGTLSG